MKPSRDPKFCQKFDFIFPTRTPKAAFGGQSDIGHLAWGEAVTSGFFRSDGDDDDTPILRRPDSILFRQEHEHVQACGSVLEGMMSVASLSIQHEHTQIPQPQDLKNYIAEKKARRGEFAHASHMSEDGDAAAKWRLAQMQYFGADAVERGSFMPNSMDISAPWLATILLILAALAFWKWEQVSLLLGIRQHLGISLLDS